MKHAVRASSKKPHLYSNRQLIALMLPLICEQIFTSFMGTVDSMMVSNVSEAAISAVSLVDSINILVIQAFYALASGGAIVCANYLGQKRQDQAERSANQLLFIIFAISLAVLAVCQLFRAPLLRLVFGSVEQEVMDAAMVYFFYTSLSFPFIALFDSGSAVFRAQNNSRLPMAITVSTNLMNIAGNALLIWGFHLGVAGAAVSTLLSRIAAALPLALDHVIGFIDLLHLLLRQIRQGVVMIVIGMVLPCQFTISLFDLLICGGTGNIEHFIGIGHNCSSSLPPRKSILSAA